MYQKRLPQNLIQLMSAEMIYAFRLSKLALNYHKHQRANDENDLYISSVE